MSQENMEVVRRLYEEGLIDRDPAELLELASPDVEYVNPPYAVEPGTRRGRDAVAQAMRTFAEVWEDSWHELHDVFDCGDVVIAEVTWRTRSRGSQHDIVHEEAHSWTFRDGKIVCFEWGTDLRKALEAAGFRE